MMTRDIDRIIEQVHRRVPNVKVWQHQVKNPRVDDDGLWWFSVPNVPKAIQIESSCGMCPFLVERDDMQSRSQAETAQSIEEAVEKVIAYLTGLVAACGGTACEEDAGVSHQDS
jgi:hypothetical protein